MMTTHHLRIAFIIVIQLITVINSQYFNPYRRHITRYPIAYNLHSQAHPKDVNSLSGAHAKRALDDATKTITSVQRLLALDPNLPRLTRGEIEDLFETVTKEEYRKSLMAGDQNRAKHMKALMLVLPFTNQTNDKNLEELFTKSPITRLIESNMKTTTIHPLQYDPATGHIKHLSTQYKGSTTYRPFHKPTQFYNKPTSPTPIELIPSATSTTFLPILKQAETLRTKETRLSFVQSTRSEEKQKPIKYSSQYGFDTFKPTSNRPPIRENVKGMLASIGLYPAQNEPLNHKPAYQTASFHPFEHILQSTTISTTSPLTTTSQPPFLSKLPEMTPEIKHLLNSFGLLNSENSSTQKFKTNKEDDNLYSNEFKPLPKSVTSLDLLQQTRIQTPEIVPDDFQTFKRLQISSNSTIKQEKKVDPDFENLLKSFGLIDSAAPRAKKSMLKDHVKDDTSPTTASHTFNSITTLFPLILTSTAKTPKAIKHIPPVSVDMLPSDMIKILDNLGIATKKHNHNYNSNGTFPLQQMRKIVLSSKAHGFRPVAETKTDEEDYEKLKQLLETIKELDNLNANLTDDEFSKLNLKQYNFSQSLLNQGPDPLDHVEIDDEKNEVKRQQKEENNNPIRITLGLTQNINDTITVTTPEPLVSTTVEDNQSADASISSDIETTKSESVTTPQTSELVSESTDEPRASDLGDSFAGGADPVAEEPLPTPRGNGFYFLQDINTFLEVGVDSDKVEIRYDRKYGDPSRFLPITVP